jgi:hypothetical protein
MGLLAAAEILRHVKPPRGNTVVLGEAVPEKDGEPNWLASVGVMDPKRLEIFNLKIVALRQSDPLVNWRGVMEREGSHRRIAKWFSELDKA